MKKAIRKNALLTEGPIIKTLLKLAAPMQVSILSMMAFNLVDIYFIGKLGTLEQAAITLTFPVIMVIITFILGLGVGTIATISHAIGEGNRTRVKRLTTDSLTLTVLVVSLLIPAGLLSIDSLFPLIGATSRTLPLVRQYMQIWYYGMIFMAVPLVGNNAIRATGDTLVPSIIMIVGVIINGILDPLLIFGLGPFPRLGLRGAALATVISRGLTFFLSLSILHFRERMITNPLPSLKILLNSWKQILTIGLPVAFSNIILPLSYGVLTRIIAPLGPAVIAGFGIAGRVQSFALTVIFALSTGLSPFVGQNMGAGKIQRTRKGIWYCMTIVLLWGMILFVVFFFAGASIASIFSDNPQVQKVSVLYFSIIAISYGLKGLHQVVWTSLNVLKKPMQSLSLEFIHAFILSVPLALLGNIIAGAGGVFGAMALANCGGGILAYLYIRHFFKKISKENK